MPAIIVEFQDVSATMEGTVIKVEAEEEESSGYYYFGPDYMEQFDGGSFDLDEGQQLPSQIGLLPDEEREVLRESLFPKEEEDVDEATDEE
jgi:hypothetical protein